MKRVYWEMIPIYAMVCLAALLIAVIGSKAATVMSENAPLEDRYCIIIDAGHGGVDGGATSCSGVLESGINLEIAIRLHDLFQLLGYETKMVRTTDASIHSQGDTIAAKKVSDLKERAKLVNETPKGILISIHQNFFQESRYAGAQVFYAATEESQILAKTVQENMRKCINAGSNRREKKASGIYLMEHINCTGILVECGFLSNPAEEKKLREPEYQMQLCCVIAASAAGFLS